MMIVRWAAFRFLRLVLLAAVLAGGLLAQYSKFEGKKIEVIQFDPVQQPLDPDELHQMLPLGTGKPLRREDVRAAMERLFASGRYADIQVDLQDYNGGVLVRFLTQNAWFIGSVSVDGRAAAPPSGTQIENAAGLDLGQPFSGSKMTQAENSLRRLFQQNGLYDATFHPVLDWETGKDHQQVNIRFVVNSGRRDRFTTPVITGDPKTSAETVLKGTGFRRWLIHTWKPMTQDRVRNGLDRVRGIFLKDHRLEAKVSLEGVHHDETTHTAQVIMHLDAGPRIQVNTVGAKVSQKKLQRYIPIFEERAVDEDLLQEGARNLRDYFQSNGYYDADVEFKRQNVINDKAAIDYLVNLGERHKLVSIRIQGNKYFSEEQLRDRLFLRPAYFLEFPHGRYSENLLRRDEESIANLYRSNGFRDVVVSHKVVDDFAGRSGQIAVTILVEEGPQYFINSLRIEGIERLEKTRAVSGLTSIQGQPFSEFNVAVDRDSILEFYFKNGFPGATFEWSMTPVAGATTVDLQYTIHEGQRQFVRQVIYSGNLYTAPGLIDRELRMNPGDPLSPTAVTETQRRLYDLGVFAKVDAAIQNPDGESDRKYVLYDLEEARRYSLALGVGAEIARIGGCSACLDAPAGQTGFSPRVSVDLSRTNLFGLAHTVSFRTRASTLEQQALVNYLWPRFLNHTNWNFSVTGLAQKSKDVRTFNYYRVEGSLQLSQRVSKATTLFYRYTYRGVGIYQGTLKITPYMVPLLSQPVRLGLLSISMVADRRDDPLDPHKGYYTTVDLGLAENVFGSQRNFLRFLGRNSSYHRLNRNLVLARNTVFGEIYAFRAGASQLDAVPLPERFFGGGSTSHRGFPEEQAGPRDAETGFPLGGTAQFFNQTELRFPLVGENIGGVLFHDMGNTYSSLRNISFRVHQRDNADLDYMVHAVGLGIRYRTPIGPLRLDLAYSINPPHFFGFKGTEADLLNAGTNPCAPGGPYANLCVQTSVSHLQFFFSIGQTF